ncbi:MAG: cupin domain-containing protein [Chloroflexi bacterium HGW-Chloroflexi-10]|nr:MAG: cupin domain-containing protein [Chloroflexi bacterium HGW-Chloroflexi-10]
MNQKNTPKVENLNHLLTIQDGAVVSRTLVNEKTGTITLFAFGQNEGLSEHTAPYDAFVQVLEGTLEVIISSKPYQLGSGDMLIMPANEPHALKAQTPVKMLLVMIRS